MTRVEKKSYRKREAIKLLVEDGEYSLAYAIMLAEQLNDEGKLLDDDYDNLMEWLEARLEPEEEYAEVEDTDPEGTNEPTQEENPIQYE